MSESKTISTTTITVADGFCPTSDGPWIQLKHYEALRTQLAESEGEKELALLDKLQAAEQARDVYARQFAETLEDRDQWMDSWAKLNAECAAYREALEVARANLNTLQPKTLAKVEQALSGDGGRKVLACIEVLKEVALPLYADSDLESLFVTLQARARQALKEWEGAK